MPKWCGLTLTCSKIWLNHSKQESGTPVLKDKYEGWWNRCFSKKVTLSAHKSTVTYAAVFVYLCVLRGNILTDFLVNLCLLTGLQPQGFYQELNMSRYYVWECWGTPTRFWFQITFSISLLLWKPGEGRATITCVRKPFPWAIISVITSACVCWSHKHQPGCFQLLSIHMSAC